MRLEPSQEHRRHPMTWLWVGLGIMLILIGVGAFLASFYRGPTSMMYPFDFFGWGFGFIWIFFAFFWIIPWFFGWGWWGWGYRYRRWYRYRDDAYEILRQRYARGEITKEQFDQMARDLNQQQPR